MKVVYFQTIDIVVRMIRAMRQVSATVKLLAPYNVPRLETGVGNQSIDFLCDLETVADDVDRRWRPMDDDWMLLPDCGATSIAATENRLDDLDVVIKLMDMLTSLKVARCVADNFETSV